jgi:hypothetical protein
MEILAKIIVVIYFYFFAPIFETVALICTKSITFEISKIRYIIFIIAWGLFFYLLFK